MHGPTTINGEQYFEAARIMLNWSLSMDDILRHEQAGRLTRLQRGGYLYYRADEIRAILHPRDHTAIREAAIAGVKGK